MHLLSSADFFLNLFQTKSSFRNTIRVSNGLATDQDQCSVGLDLSPNCLQRGQKSPPAKNELRHRDPACIGVL